MLALPLVGFVSLGKPLHLSEPWLHRLQKQGNHPYLTDGNANISVKLLA